MQLFTARFRFLVFGIALMVAWIGCQPRRGNENESQGNAERQKGIVFTPDGDSIAYEVSGSGSPAIVLIHCWSCDRSYWDQQVGFLSSNYSVIRLDLAGHGESSGIRGHWSMETYGNDVASVVNHLGLENMILVGHSMGGTVMLEAARLLPGKVIGLIAVDTHQNIEEQFDSDALDNFIDMFRMDFRNTTFKYVQSLFYPSSDTVLRNYIASDMASGPESTGLASFESLFDYDVPAGMEQVALPVICINSMIYPTDVVAGKRHAPQFETILMDSVGHFPQLERPELFNRNLAKAIRKMITWSHRPAMH